ERVLHIPRDAGVAADAELSEAARPLVAVERLEQELLVRTGRGVHDATALEAEPHARQLPAGVDRRELAEQDLAFGGILDRAAEELAPRHVRAAGVDLHAASGDADPQVGAVADDPHLVRSVEP